MVAWQLAIIAINAINECCSRFSLIAALGCLGEVVAIKGCVSGNASFGEGVNPFPCGVSLVMFLTSGPP